MKLKDTEFERWIREVSCADDYTRPETERFLNRFYNSLSASPTSANRKIPHSDIFYIRVALEAKFPDRLFTVKEITQLISEVYGVSY